MTHRFTVLDALTVMAAAGLVAAALWIAVHGPTGPIPMHFDLQGQPDRWGDRNELAWTLASMGGLLAVIAGGMGLYAARDAEPARRRGLRLGQGITLLVIPMTAGVMIWTMLSGVQADSAAPAWHMVFLAVVCLVVGAGLGRVPPNIAVGVRTPWTYKSRLAWDRSNRLAGRLMFWIGLGALLAAPVVPQPLGMMLAVGAVLAAAAWSVFESWRVWRTDPNRQPF